MHLLVTYTHVLCVLFLHKIASGSKLTKLATPTFSSSQTDIKIANDRLPEERLRNLDGLEYVQTVSKRSRNY